MEAETFLEAGLAAVAPEVAQKGFGVRVIPISGDKFG